MGLRIQMRQVETSQFHGHLRLEIKEVLSW